MVDQILQCFSGVAIHLNARFNLDPKRDGFSVLAAKFTQTVIARSLYPLDHFGTDGARTGDFLTFLLIHLPVLAASQRKIKSFAVNQSDD